MLSFGDDVGLLFLKPQMQADQMELVTQVMCETLRGIKGKPDCGRVVSGKGFNYTDN